VSAAAPRAATLTAPNGYFFSTPRPQFAPYMLLDVVGVLGFDNTGATDISDKLQAALQQYAGNRVLFFPSGTYAIAKTVYVPAGSRLHGQVWSVFLADGPAFADANTPTPMLLVGKPGEQGVAQFVDVMFSARGAQPGAVLVQWHMSNPANRGLCGMWDSHFRLGGALVTGLDPSRCPANAGSSAETAACSTANTLLHITPSGSAYMENVWGWTADHFIDQVGSPQTNIYVQRGFVCEGGPVWMYGTAFEHSTLFQYNFQNAHDVVMAMIQTETPYYQPSPTTPFAPGPSDPSYCSDDFRCKMAYALHIRNSSNIYLYGAGLYSFFNVWSQACLKGAQPTCQKNLVRIVDSHPVYLYSLNTYGTQYMLTSDQPYSEAAIQDNTFCSSAAVDLNLF
jgi:glucan 1,3-beta-glucosidase